MYVCPRACHHGLFVSVCDKCVCVWRERPCALCNTSVCVREREKEREEKEEEKGVKIRAPRSRSYMETTLVGLGDMHI